MIRILRFVIAFVGMLLVFSTCTTKEIRLITNIDFEVAVTNETTGFVNDAMETTVKLTPQSTDYPGFRYSFSYEVTAGAGYFISDAGERIAAGQAVALEKAADFTKTLYYIGTSVGAHKVQIISRDNFEKRKTNTVAYELQNAEVRWEVTAALTTVKVGDTLPLQLELAVLRSGEVLNFAYTPTLTEAKGTLWSADQKPIPLGQSRAISPGNTTVYFVANQAGTTTVYFALEDSNGQELNTRIALTVTLEDENQPPIAGDDVAITAENTPIAIPVLDNDTDPENKPLEIVATTSPTYGTVEINPNGTITYTPEAGYFGSDSFSYTISDGDLEAAAAVVAISITDVNQPPVAVDDTAETDKNLAVDIPVLINDEDEDNTVLNISNTTVPENGTIIINPNGSIKYTPNSGYFGTDSFTYTISDGIDESVTSATVAITINDRNQPPVAVDDTFDILANVHATLDVLANDTDEDDDIIEYKITVFETPLHGSYGVDNGKVDYFPNDGFYGLDSLKYSIIDAVGNTAKATVTINVSAIEIGLTDMRFEEFLVDEGIDSDTSVNGKILRSDVEKITSLDLSMVEFGSSDIRIFSNLKSLNLSNKSKYVSSSGYSKLLKLEELYLENTIEVSAFISKNTSLKVLRINNSKIRSLDLSNNIELLELSAIDVPLDKINLRNNSTNLEIAIETISGDVCVEADDIGVAQNNTNWIFQNTSVTYSSDCGF